MSVTLIQGRRFFLPMIPQEIKDKATRDYLLQLTVALEAIATKLVDNDTVLFDKINTGTSGSFDDSGGAAVTVSDGIITALS